MIRDFEEYIQDNTVTKQSPDHARADHLEQESQQAQQVLNEITQTIGITNTNANTLIKIAYDAIMAQIRADMIREGLNAAGRGAHEAEIAYLRKQETPEEEIQFLDQLRYFRNGIMYYGKNFDAEYAQKVLTYTKKRIHKNKKE